MTDYVTNQAGELSTTTIWTPNGHPGINDQITLNHKVTITNTVEYIRRLIINNGATGELEINATSQDSGLEIQDATLALIDVKQGSPNGKLDLNGDKANGYRAFIRANSATPAHDTNTTLSGDIEMNYGEISGFWFGQTISGITYDWIKCDYMKLTMIDSFIKAYHPHPFYFNGAPDADNPPSMTRSEFINMYPALYYNASNYFAFNEFLRDMREFDEAIEVRHGVIGRTMGRKHQLGMMGEQMEFRASWDQVANRWRAAELKELSKKNYKWWLFLPEEIYQAVHISDFEHYRPRGNPYHHDVYITMDQCDPD